MILLKNKQNTNGVSAQYPYGNMRDKTAGQNGTKADSLFMNDIVQFFEKMFAESGVTPNNLPDDATNGFQLYEAFRKLTRPYKVYNALISQVGTSAPTIIVLHNEIGNIVWTRDVQGLYTGSLTGAFSFLKTVFTINNNTFDLMATNVEKINSSDINSITISTSSGGTNTDGLLDKTSIEIRVYD